MNDSTAVILGLSSFVLFVVVYVWIAIALSAVFRKAGEEGWKAWVPIVNLATVVKLGGFSPYLVLIVLVPIFGAIAFAVIWVIALHRVSLGFGAGGGMTVLGVLLLPVWASVLGFGDARWQGAPATTARNDDEDAAGRRRQEFDGPYVPLVGGWTPSDDDDVRDPFGMPPAPAADTPRPPAPVSEPVAVPFAAPAGSLADAVPAPVDWAPPSRQHEDPAPPTSVFAALDAMRDSAPEEVAPAADRDARPTAAAGGDARATSSFPAVDDDVRPDRTAGADTAAARSNASADDVASAPVRSTAAEALEATPPAASPFAAAPSAPAPSEPAPSAAAPSAPVGDAPAERDDASDAPWAQVPRRSNATPAAADAPIASVPLTRPAPAPEPAPAAAVEAHDDFPEPSEAVSAVVGAPDAGAPRSARTSVSALHAQPELPGDDDDDFDAMDRTVVARRRRIPWALIPPGGTPVDITSTIVILGRRPAADRAFPDAQLIAIPDETRTVSKTHARLELRADTWYVTDLGSTNGVLFATLMGTEVEAPPGEEIEAGERFFLGDAEVRLARSEA